MATFSRTLSKSLLVEGSPASMPVGEQVFGQVLGWQWGHLCSHIIYLYESRSMLHGGVGPPQNKIESE